MSASPQPPARLASEDVIINAPMSYAGSAQRIFRLRRRAHSGGANVAVTVLAIVLVLLAWVIVTAWYLLWGIWLIPYRILRRGARKRKAETLRHRELMGTIQGSAAGSAAAGSSPFSLARRKQAANALSSSERPSSTMARISGSATASEAAVITVKQPRGPASPER